MSGLGIACASCAILLPIGFATHAWFTRTGETRCARAVDFAIPAFLMLPVGAFLGFMIPVGLYALGLLILSMFGARP